MADTYWDHPSRREIKRLIDLGDAGAILDDLQNRETEWDDAGEALDYLVRGPRAEAERLRAELADTVGEARSDIAGLESLARRLRTAWESARRGRREARQQVKAARPYIDWLHEQRRALFAEVTSVRTELDAAREQVKRVRDRHPRKTDDADCVNADTTFGCQHGPGYHTVEYCGTCDDEWPCAEIRALDGTEGGQ